MILKHMIFSRGVGTMLHKQKTIIMDIAGLVSVNFTHIIRGYITDNPVILRPVKIN